MALAGARALAFLSVWRCVAFHACGSVGRIRLPAVCAIGGVLPFVFSVSVCLVCERVDRGGKACVVSAYILSVYLPLCTVRLPFFLLLCRVAYGRERIQCLCWRGGALNV